MIYRISGNQPSPAKWAGAAPESPFIRKIGKEIGHSSCPRWMLGVRTGRTQFVALRSANLTGLKQARISIVEAESNPTQSTCFDHDTSFLRPFMHCVPTNIGNYTMHLARTTVIIVRREVLRVSQLVSCPVFLNLKQTLYLRWQASADKRAGSVERTGSNDPESGNNTVYRRIGLVHWVFIWSNMNGGDTLDTIKSLWAPRKTGSGFQCSISCPEMLHWLL